MGTVNRMSLEGSSTSDLFEKATLANDVLFREVMSDPVCMKPFVSWLVGKDVQIDSVETQKQLGTAANPDSGVRLDVVCSDSVGTIYNVEVQTARKPNLIERARYYSSALDVGLVHTNHGRSYRLPDTHVVFLCSSVAMPSDAGAIIHGEMMFHAENNGARIVPTLSDGRHLWFINYEWIASDRLSFPDGVGGLASALVNSQGSAVTDYELLLQSRVNMALGREEVKSAMLSEEEKRRLREEGREEGREEERAAIVYKVAKMYSKTLVEACDFLGFDSNIAAQAKDLFGDPGQGV